MKPDLEREVNELHAGICSALADPRRILMLYALNEMPRSVGDLAEALAISQSATSRHLNLLRERGLASSRREGASVVYALTDERIIQALDLLRAVLAGILRNQAALADTARAESE
jgi:ArsR family transcriptional regulator